MGTDLKVAYGKLEIRPEFFNAETASELKLTTFTDGESWIIQGFKEDWEEKKRIYRQNMWEVRHFFNTETGSDLELAIFTGGETRINQRLYQERAISRRVFRENREENNLQNIW